MDVNQSSVDGGRPPVSRSQSSLDGGQRSFKDACLYDGGLLNLPQDVIENLRRENIQLIGTGSFGQVYKSASKSEDFGIHVVVKKIHIPLRYSFIAHTIKREMKTSRILHPFILPLLAIVDLPSQNWEREFWFVSPLCENGDLYKVLRHDRMQQIPKLNGQKRVKILLQVALAIKYIHTEVPDVRAVLLHKDIASKNIVLDEMYNARLIDFGLVSEEDNMKTTAGGRLFYLHPNVGTESANESWDYYSFGVIVREMITTFGPEGQGPTHLKNMKAEYITDNIYKKIWEHDHLENAHEKLNDIATKLLRPNNWKVQGFTDNVIEELKKIYTAIGQSCFLDVSKERGQACHSCMIKTKAKQTSMNQTHRDNCTQKIEVCMACEKNSLLNPIICYCGTQLTPTFGSLPMVIQQMDQSSIHLYMKLLDEGYEVVCNIRVVVVGHKGAGKTTLTKRLLNRDVDIGKEESTNGIEVHVNRCKVSRETKQWIISESDKKPTSAQSQRLVELLTQSVTSTGKTDVKDDTIEEDSFENGGDKKPTSSPSQRLVEPLKQSATSTGSNLRKKDVKDDTIEEDSFENGEANQKVVNDEEEAFTSNGVKYSDIEIVKDLQDTLHESMQMPTQDSKTADVSIWDFAGQTEFYDTHQVFLTKKAVYLLVTDISKQVNDIVEDGNKNWKISEFVDFWLTSIYEFCGTKDSYGPPVILVGAFADKLKQESKEETISTFFYNLRRCLMDHEATFNLLKKCIPIDNSIKDDNIEELKRYIVEEAEQASKQASEQEYWGELYPAKFITLERSIVKLKDKGEKILKKDQLFELNAKLPVPIKQEEGLDLFLRFHHDSGNILYFSEEELSQTIVLDPQWLIDAFKSLITARYFCSSHNSTIFKEWIKFEESAILKETLIEEIWKLEKNIEFHKHRHLLLKYLEKLGIIAKPHHLPGTTDVTDYYFAPCFLKQTPPDDLLSPERLPEKRRSTSKLCLTTKLQFLHAAVFNKLLAACINKWQLSKKDGKYLVYRGCAIFDLKQNHTLYVYFFNHVIQIWLTKYSTKKEKPSQSVCIDVYTFLLDRLTNCLKRSGDLKVLFKCSSSKHNSIENMFSKDELSEKSEVKCKCTTEEHVFQTKELTEYWLNTKMFQKSSCIFDGRLMLLQNHEIIILESSLNEEPTGKGKVYLCNNQEIFGIPVAVKKIKTKCDPKIESQVRREKIACRLMNPFILPLLAVVEKSKEEVWLISPYCENGDLHAAIARGKDQNSTDEININQQATRVKILLQIALAIQYIHTPVQNVRGPILHQDIASKNVVLDKYLNARLINFGLAREKDDNPDVGDGKGAKEYNDIHSFGIIIRDMLTSLELQEDDHFLMEKNQIEERLDAKVWKCEEVIQTLNDLSYNCLKCPWTIEDFKAKVIYELRNIMERTLDCAIFENKEEVKCHQCIINPIAEKSSLTEDNANCRKKIRVCMACEKNSFLNPVICYCGERLSSKIGTKWGALLVAGDDESQEKADTMKNEILELERIVTSLAPRIIGISKCKVKTVVPDDSESKTKKGESQTWLKIKGHIKNFSEDKEIDTLLIYFSCHGGSSTDGNMFELGKKSEYISLDEFQKELDKLHKIDRLILFLDRCFPPKVTLEKRKFVQINACSEDKKAVLNEEGSLFTKYVIQGLKGRSEERECSKDCKHCDCFWNSRTEYVSICSLYDYVNKHLELKAPQPDWKLESFGENIAFFTDEVVKIEFSSKDAGITIPLSLGCLKNMDMVKQEILLAFKVDTNTHKVKIRRDTFRNDQQVDDECTTLEQVMEAWVQRFPLSVSFHKKEGT